MSIRLVDSTFPRDRERNIIHWAQDGIKKYGNNNPDIIKNHIESHYNRQYIDNQPQVQAAGIGGIIVGAIAALGIGALFAGRKYKARVKAAMFEIELELD